jgi:hypothetical protein
MTSESYVYNILLSKDFLMGKMSAPTRKKGDWYHSISVFTSNDIEKLNISEKIPCTIIHFFGRNGSPVLSKIESYISTTSVHRNVRLYNIDSWEYSLCVIGQVRTLNGYEKGTGKCSKSISNIIENAFEKWGDSKIPYAHQRNEGYNCVAFVDDIFSFSTTENWSDRISKVHNKYRLYM